MSKDIILVTGGAGFIGSHIVEELLRHKSVLKVKVIDNLSTGRHSNIEKFLGLKNFEFIHGDICDYDLLNNICKDVTKISHQAALGSVPRSISDPCSTVTSNILGTVNLMKAAHDNKVDIIVHAFSSSTYGDLKASPKVENTIGKPLSPYAVTKAANEDFARVFGDIYGLDWIGLRYFNVYGQRQRPDGAYAAVIPKLCYNALKGLPLRINGSLNIARDFTHVSNVVEANILALYSENEARNQVFNIGTGRSITLGEIVDIIKSEISDGVEVQIVDFRKGDIMESVASVDKAVKLLGYKPIDMREKFIQEYCEWLKYQI